MEGFSKESMKKIVKRYTDIEHKKNHIEGKTAYHIMNTKYYEQIRHALSHLISVLSLELSENKSESEKLKIENLYQKILHHMDNIDVNGYEYLAGGMLSELTGKLEREGFFVSVGK